MDYRSEILAHLDEDYAMDLLSRMVEFPSVFPNYTDIAAFVEKEMRSYGLDVFVKGDSGTGVVTDPVRAEHAKAFEHDFKDVLGKPWTRPNVVGTLKGMGGGRALILRAHTDVVPPYDLSRWKTPPFKATIKDGRIWGRGTADAKGSLAGMMTAFRAVAASGVKLKGNATLVAWVGDEFKPPDSAHFDGISYLAKNDLIKAEMFVAGEPYDLKICYMTRGRIWFHIEVVGESTHGANYPVKGVNAILKAYDLIQEVFRIGVGEHPVTGKDSINLGTIRGGVQPNIVPDSCDFTFDIRFAPPLTTARIEQMLNEKIEMLKARDPKFVVKSVKVTERREPIEFPRECQLTRALKDAGACVGRDLAYGGAVSFGALGEYRDQVGVKECCYFGPGETDQAHSLNESIKVEDYKVGCKVYALAMADACGVAG